MALRREKKRLIQWLVLGAFLMQVTLLDSPLARAALLDIDIPVEPVRSIQYTEDLVEITNFGVIDSEGDFVDIDEIESTEEARAASLLDSIQKSVDAGEEDSFEEYRQSLIESWGGKLSFTEQRLDGVRENLTQQQKAFTELERQIAVAEERLAPIRQQAQDLKGQIDLINGQVRITKDKISNVESLIAEKQVALKDLMLGMRRKEIEMQIQERIVMDYIRLLYQEEDKYLSLGDQNANTMKLLLADASVSENLLGKDYLAVMEETGRKVFYDLDRSRRELADQQEELSAEQEKLEYLHGVLVREKLTLEETRFSKKTLLEETQGEEEKYRLLLEQSIQEQLETAISIQNLQENLSIIEEKLGALDRGLEEIRTAEYIDPGEAFDDPDEKPIPGLPSLPDLPNEADSLGKAFAWPVPANKITAEFHDASYPAKWGSHNAIDIRASQFTEIRAPANAYVFQTKDNGNGYSYIILAHKNNLVTVYGHVTEIIAKPGTVVKRGQVIGLSGGTPGTKGAGLQTTGPHLHFEVHYKGEPVNPLDYLPLDDLPIEYVPNEYLEKLN